MKLNAVSTPKVITDTLTTERRATLLASLGSALEYYDFVVYGMLAQYLKNVFFPANNDSLAMFQFYSVFALGYLVRPLGGMIAGVLGDRFGRRPVFLCLTMMMALSTLALGVLPNYNEMGYWAIVLLIICRLMQGLSFGGELPGATTIVAEFSPFQRRGRQTSWVIASVSIGALSASLALFLMTSFLTADNIIAGGWRIPFILGGILGIILFWKRRHLMETPAFQALGVNAKQNKPLKEIVRGHKTSLCTGIALTAFFSAMTIVNLYFPYYIHHYFLFSEQSIYLAATLSLIFSASVLPWIGQLSDRLPKNTLLRWTTFIYLISSIALFHLLSFQHVMFLILFMMLHQLFIAIFAACYFPMMVTLFPSNVRYTGIALCYNLVYALMGILPTVLTALLSQYHSPLVLPLVLSCMALITLLAVYHSKKLNNNPGELELIPNRA